MSTWYIIENYTLTLAESILIEEVDGDVYERHVTGFNGEDFKIEGDHLFPLGVNIHILKDFSKRYPDTVKEITEGEAFAILL